jgi:phosphoribosylglycinamide formyltransferase-1
MAKLKVAVFASGNGSNFQALADGARDGRIDADIRLLVCDKPSAPVIKRAEAAGIETYVFRPRDYPSREAYEREILIELKRRGVELIVLAGYMRIVTPVLVDAFYGRMINVHPSLLPAFPGLNGIGLALEYGVKVTGVTVHFVDGGLDTGPIIAQEALAVEPGDTEETLAARIHSIEHRLLLQVVQQFAEDRIRLNGRQVAIEPK